MLMNGFLITPTLYSAWKYWKESEGSGKNEILDVLNKAEGEKSPAMRAGIEFENAIRNVCDGGTSEDFCVLEAADIVKGGMWQQRVSKELDGDLLYGIADVVRRNAIFDIKRAFKYDLGQYEGSIQPLIYMYATGIPNFDYVISDGQEVYVETYHWEARSLDLLKERIADMKGSFLSDDEMRLAFQNRWTYRKEEGQEVALAAAKLDGDDISFGKESFRMSRELRASLDATRIKAERNNGLY
jgi:hypothetical protein